MAEAYFRSCAVNALAALGSKRHDASYSDQQARRKQCQQLKTAVQELISSCKPASAVSELLHLALDLSDQSEPSLALQLCCNNSLRLLSSQIHSVENVALSAQVNIITARVSAAVLADSDPTLLLSESVNELVATMRKWQAAMQSVLPHEQHHWLVLYGALTLQWISQVFARAPGPEMLQFTAFACLALETDISFSLPEHLPLRVDLYLAVAHNQQAAGRPAEALSTVQRGLAAIAAIEKLEQLDPLPPPPEAQAAYEQAKTRLNTALFAMSAPSLATEQAVKDSLDSMFTSEMERLAALANSLLPAAPARVLKHEACPASHTKLMNITEALLKPQIQVLKTQTDTAFDNGTRPVSANQQLADDGLPVSVHQVLQALSHSVYLSVSTTLLGS